MTWPTQITISFPRCSPLTNWIMSHSRSIWGNTLDTFNFRAQEVHKNGCSIWTYTSPHYKNAGPLTHIFNSSGETAVSPEDWKSATVTAFTKRTVARTWILPSFFLDATEPGYPGRKNLDICLTSVVCKTMERFVKENLLAHLEMNNLIGDSQHGFRNKRRCQTSMLDFFAQVIENKAVDLVYLDFQKTFDKVPHERPMAKANAHCIHGNAARFFPNKLAGRHHISKMQCNYSHHT